jgi:hypothetical protein
MSLSRWLKRLARLNLTAFVTTEKGAEPPFLKEFYGLFQQFPGTGRFTQFYTIDIEDIRDGYYRCTG